MFFPDVLAPQVPAGLSFSTPTKKSPGATKKSPGSIKKGLTPAKTPKSLLKTPGSVKKSAGPRLVFVDHRNELAEYTRNDDPDFEPGIRRLSVGDALGATATIAEETRPSPASSCSKSSKRASTGSVPPEELSPSSSIRAITQSPANSLKAQSPKGQSPKSAPSPAQSVGSKRASQSPAGSSSGGDSSKKARSEAALSPVASIAVSPKDGSTFVVLGKESPAVQEIQEYFGGCPWLRLSAKEVAVEGR
jgi:hypothetical protein